ncbi:MAG: ABC transporter permease [Nitrospirota bacterium]|nr:ABC transporter permease [Nitrospirota bacterium]
MVSLARASLIYEWKRYLAAVLAVAFAGLLILVQIGTLLGQLATSTVVLDRASADLWVMAPNTESYDLARDMPGRYEMHLRMHPEVAAVQEMIFGFGDWRTPQGGKVTVFIMGLNTSNKSLSLPDTFDESLRLSLQEIGGVVVDEADIRKLKTRAGDRAEINDKSIRVTGITQGFRAIGGAYVFTSMVTARDLMEGLIMDDYTQYFLIKLHDPAKLEAVQAELQAQGDSAFYTVLTPEAFSYLSQDYWLTESGAGAAFAFSAVLALLVGIAITSQTLRAAILASIKEYATLRALGVSVKSLRAVVLEQAFWVGIIGLILSLILSYAIYFIAKANHVAIAFPLWSVIASATFMLAVALLSGVLAIKPLYETEPADLLR